jgi:hypothetical protein
MQTNAAAGNKSLQAIERNGQWLVQRSNAPKLARCLICRIRDSPLVQGVLGS